MPRGDRTGPMGFGPMTGRSVGYCAGTTASGFMNTGVGAGAGRGCAGRGGRGFRNMYYSTGMPGWARYGYSPGWQTPQVSFAHPYQAMPYASAYSQEKEKNALEQQAAMLEQQIEGINTRLKELENDEDEQSG